MIRGHPKRMYGAPAVVSADNLGSLGLEGFKGSCSALRMCRQCMTTKAESQKQVNNWLVIPDVITVCQTKTARGCKKGRCQVK